MARASDSSVLLEIHPDSVVDLFGGEDAPIHERGEVKKYTADEAKALLALEYGGRAVFRRVEPLTPSKAEEPAS